MDNDLNWYKRGKEAKREKTQRQHTETDASRMSPKIMDELP
jgi:hypothetical protein